LSEADIDKMVKDAEVHAAEDKKRRELVDAKNQGEAMVHSAEKSLAEFGDKVSEADRSAIEAAKAALKTALEGDDVEAIKARTNDLVQASMKLGEAMYKAQAGGAGGPDGGAPGAGGEGGGASHEAKNDDVIDADFKEVGGDHKKSA
jgi:molecular chaperone DnaK